MVDVLASSIDRGLEVVLHQRLTLLFDASPLSMEH